MQSLKTRIKQHAATLGFAACGVTTPDPPPHLDAYGHWLDAGMHGQLGYMGSARNRARRADPRLILPAAQSVLVLLTNYYTEVPPPATDDNAPRGQFARYALNDDYHDVLLARLKQLLAFIEDAVGQPVVNRYYTDTGPILERELAQRAGLGWIAKNSMLITPAVGSYTLLAELFLDLPLPPDPPFAAGHCGTCTRCIDACPTAAILPGRVVDARACISYHTIELKAAIPNEWRAPLGNWVFGCDICQDVCPWNRFAAPSSDPAFTPRHSLPTPRLVDLLAMSRQDFNATFRNSAVKRTKRRGLLRNVAVALGNTHDPEVIPALRTALRHEAEPLVRAHVAWALGQIAHADAHAALQAARDSESDPKVLDEIEQALAQHRPDED